MSFISEFKQFIAKGNVIDMATGVVIGTAFGKIVSSMVSDIIMPPMGFFTSGISFKELKLELQPAVKDSAGGIIEQAVTINYGIFLQNILDFLIIALVIFSALRFINKLKQPKEETSVEPPPSPPAPTAEELLLMEIRDILKSK
jgi:large conductance mechanosensitive channel